MPLEEWAAAVGLFIGFCLVVGIPAIVILTHHQRKIALVLRENHGSQQDQVLAQLAAMNAKIEEMQDRQNELILQKHDESPPPLPKVEGPRRE